MHICPLCGPTKVSSGTKFFTINSRPVACVGDRLDCGAVIISGSLSMTVRIS
ncbi:PAAR domain-containing protein [Pseudomonas capeferrum]|uniref:PAAR domain-containing protein n=1 Tax=unclassified Pseudomonas TaxID=196821 RepID=UPI0021C2FDF3|nr:MULTISPECIES: PAAR domain-containing protein [unclassified Pseudomonas]